MNPKDAFETFKTFPQLETGQLVLREIKPSDTKDLFRFMSDEHTVKQNLMPPHTKIAETDKLIKTLKKQYDRRREIRWGVTIKGSNAIIGTTGYYNMLPMDFQGTSASEREEIAEEILDKVNLSDRMDFYPNQLSGGEAQRIGVARALSADPPILLMDEPFGAVDPLTRERLQVQFIDIQKKLKKTIILVTHDLDEAIRLADRIAIMASGRLIQYDTPEIILSRPADKFVHDFIGTDRALKRLSRIGIENFVKASPWIELDASIGDAQSVCKRCRWVWVVDKDKKLLGWIDRASLVGAASVTEAIVTVDRDAVAITSGATLKEALSRMLSQGLNNLPVVDNQGYLIGEVTLGDIEVATKETGV